MDTVAPSDEDGKPDWRLKQLFDACDTKGTGYVGREDFRGICAGLGIGTADSETLFSELDHGGDGRIDYDDFVKGFREFISRPQTSSPPDIHDTNGIVHATTKEDGQRSTNTTPKNSVRQTKRTEQTSPTVWRHFLDQLKTSCSGDLE